MKLKSIVIRYTDIIPEKLDNGFLYVSKEYQTAIHLCACGCGEKTVTPLGGPHGWGLMIQGTRATLSHSIGNYQIPCKSHYFIKDGKIIFV